MESNDHLFRREAGRMVSALTRVFGIHNLALAEDVARMRSAARWKSGNIAASPKIRRRG
jgi:RNA polymerase sigma-70 factor (ECF subfamily)